MKTTEHVTPEEVMAWVDGELAAAEARVVDAHVAECAECASVAAGFRRLSEQMAEWSVAEAPARLEAAVMSAAGERGTPPVRKRRVRMGHPHWGRWAAGLAGATSLLMLAVVPVWYRGHEAKQAMLSSEMQSDSSATDADAKLSLEHRMAAVSTAEPAPPAASQTDAMSGGGDQRGRAAAAQAELQEQAARSQLNEAKAGASSKAAASAEQAAAPMIARSVSLTVRVQDVDVSRAAVESVLTRHHGYAAQMNANTVEGSARTFTASLRIPAPELAAALKDLRGLGHVENETQSGDEVTEQHQDLAARLKNARETETRLQAILEQRTGRISDVLEVEQEMARVRGEIESMEADQAALEHRVDFASVDLELAEQYKAEFGVPADSVGTRLRNSFVEGFRNAGDMVLGLVLFAEEYGPALMVWAALLALPGVWLWRRYRRALAAR